MCRTWRLAGRTPSSSARMDRWGGGGGACEGGMRGRMDGGAQGVRRSCGFSSDFVASLCFTITTTPVVHRWFEPVRATGHGALPAPLLRRRSQGDSVRSHTHPLTHSLTHLPTHSLTHSLRSRTILPQFKLPPVTHPGGDVTFCLAGGGRTRVCPKSRTVRQGFHPLGVLGKDFIPWVC